MKTKFFAIAVTVTLALALIVAVVGSVAVAVNEDSSSTLTREQFNVPADGVSDSRQGLGDSLAYSAFKLVCPFH